MTPLKTLLILVALVVAFFVLCAKIFSQTTQPVDISSRSAAASPGTTIYFTKSVYTMNGNGVVIKTGVTLDGQGSILTCANPGGSTNFSLRNPHVTLRNWNVTKAGIFARVLADSCSIQNCTFGSPTAGSVGSAAVSDWSGSNFSFVNNDVGVTAAWSLYLTCNNSTIKNCRFAGSQGEYCVRFDPNASGIKPVGALIDSCHITNHNVYHKQALGFREIDSARMTNTIVDGSCRWGQVSALAGACNRNSIIDHCKFLSCDSSGNPIQVYQGTNLSVTYTVFAPAINQCYPPIAEDHHSTLYVANNTQQVWTGQTPKRLVGISSQGTVTYGGGNGVQYVAPSTTQP